MARSLVVQCSVAQTEPFIRDLEDKETIDIRHMELSAAARTIYRSVGAMAELASKSNLWEVISAF
jgi:hypothetical protein